MLVKGNDHHLIHVRRPALQNPASLHDVLFELVVGKDPQTRMGLHASQSLLLQQKGDHLLVPYVIQPKGDGICRLQPSGWDVECVLRAHHAHILDGTKMLAIRWVVLYRHHAGCEMPVAADRIALAGADFYQVQSTGHVCDHGVDHIRTAERDKGRGMIAAAQHVFRCFMPLNIFFLSRVHDSCVSLK